MLFYYFCSMLIIKYIHICICMYIIHIFLLRAYGLVQYYLTRFVCECLWMVLVDDRCILEEYTLVKTIKGSTCFIAFFFCAINEHKSMKLRENNYYERINWNLYCWEFGNNLQMNTIKFLLKNYLLRKGKILIFLENK